MAATVVEIADAVVVALNAATLSMPFVAVRAYVPVYELAELADLKVTVVSRALSMRRASRRDDDFEYVIDVAIQQRVADCELDTIDPYMLLVEEIVDLFRGQVLVGYETAANITTENDPIYQPEHMDGMRVFTSVVRLTFAKMRAR